MQPTNMSGCCLLGPARRRVQIPREKLANFAKLLLLDSLQSPLKPPVFPGHRLRQAPPWQTRPPVEPAPTSQAAVTREGEPELRAGLGLGSTSSCCPGKDLSPSAISLLTQHFPSTVICGLACDSMISQSHISVLIIASTQEDWPGRFLESHCLNMRGKYKF